MHTVFGVSSGKRKLGPQKKATIPKNIDRMSIAHLQVESLDAALKETKKAFASFNKKERGQLKREFKEKSNLMDVAYSELKRAQDALNKSIVQKRRD